MVDPARVLSPDGLRVAAWLAVPAVIDHFYLAGGTGLALQIGHRMSVDFDWFSSTQPLLGADRIRLMAALRAAVPANEDVRVVREEDGTLVVRVAEVDVSFFAYPYAMLQPPSVQHGLKLASLADIAAMKLSAIIGRGSRKDFIDLDADAEATPRMLTPLDWARLKDDMVAVVRAIARHDAGLGPVAR